MADLTLQTLIEFRGEMREFRDETRTTLADHGHQLNLLTAHVNDLVARLTSVEEKLATLP